VGKEDKPLFNNCSLMIVLNVTAFRALPDFKAELERLIAYLKASRVAPGGEVLYPGEKEARSEAQRRAKGVPLAETTIAKIQAEMERYGVPGALLEAGSVATGAAWKY